jgi:hypothetical protein
MEGKPMDEKETGRLQAFSDGVFAVAITLLVLNIKIPGLDLPPSQLPDDPSLWQALRDEWPMLAAYAISFATIGIMWLNHHRLFVHIQYTNTVLLLLNLLLLSFQEAEDPWLQAMGMKAVPFWGGATVTSQLHVVRSAGQGGSPHSPRRVRDTLEW